MSKRGQTLAFVLLVIAPCVSGEPPLEELFEQTYPVSANATLSVRNSDGTIYIYGSDDNSIKVTARKKAYSQERLKKISVNVRTSESALEIDTIYPPKPGGLSIADRSGTVDYTILVPQTCTVSQADLVNGEIIIEGLRGRSANARLTNGRIMAKNTFSSAQLEVANGGLDIFYDWWEPLKFLFAAEIANGHIRFDLPSYSAARIDAVSANGKIRNPFSKTRNADENGADFKLRATNGNITIHKGD